MIKRSLIWCLNLVRRRLSYSRKTALSWLVFRVHGGASKWSRWDRIERFLMNQQKPQTIRMIRFHGHHYRGRWHLPTVVFFWRIGLSESTCPWPAPFVLLESLNLIELKARVVKWENLGLWRPFGSEFAGKIVHVLKLFHVSILLLIRGRRPSLGRWWLIPA